LSSLLLRKPFPFEEIIFEERRNVGTRLRIVYNLLLVMGNIKRIAFIGDAVIYADESSKYYLPAAKAFSYSLLDGGIDISSEVVEKIFYWRIRRAKGGVRNSILFLFEVFSQLQIGKGDSV